MLIRGHKNVSYMYDTHILHKTKSCSYRVYTFSINLLKKPLTITNSGDKTLLYVACSLAGTFLLTTLLTCAFAGRKLYLTESSSTDLEDDYINNNVCASQGTSSRNPPSRPVPQLPSTKIEDKGERVYNNFELYPCKAE